MQSVVDAAPKLFHDKTAPLRPIALVRSNSFPLQRVPHSTPRRTLRASAKAFSYNANEYNSDGLILGRYIKEQDQPQIPHGTVSELALTSSTATTLSLSSHQGLQDVLPSFDPKSPASLALAKANAKIDATILDKRMRIGKAKLGRTKYNDDKTSKKKPIGPEIHNDHEQYALTYGMMCGILNSVGLQNPFKQRLTMEDFMCVEKRDFPASSKLQHAFKFKDYAPDIFKQIRRRFSIDPANYMITLCDFNYIEFMSNSKSGQFFFYSHDGRFMIKTQTKEESKFLRRILPHYYKFIMENPNTLVTRFYGMHRVKMHHLRRKMHFIIMASVFNTPLEIHARFDLKGSKVGRYATAKERQNHGVLKDMDLLDSSFRLEVSAERRAMLLMQIRKDVEFLKRMKIMDYSMLIGIHDTSETIQSNVYALARKTESKNEIGDAHVENEHLEIPKILRSTSAPDTGKLYDSTLDNEQSPTLRNLESRGRVLSDPVSYMDTQNRINRSYRYLMDFTEENSTSSNEKSETFNGRDINLYSPKCTINLKHTEEHDEIILSPRSLDVNKYPAHSESIFCRDKGGMYGRDRFGRKNGHVYFLGVIDILQQYNTRKIAETFFRGLRYNRKQISAVNPIFYGDRFIEFMEKYVILDENLTTKHQKMRHDAVTDNMDSCHTAREF